MLIVTGTRGIGEYQKLEVRSHTVQRCKSIPSTGVRVGAIRAEITGGKGRSVTLCPPSGTFYSTRIRALSAPIAISRDTFVNIHEFVRIKIVNRVFFLSSFLPNVLARSSFEIVFIIAGKLRFIVKLLNTRYCCLVYT